MVVYNVKSLPPDREIRVRVPGSKSVTNRAFLLAALAEGESRLIGVQFSEDSRHFLNGLLDLGYDIRIDEKNKEVFVKGSGSGIPFKQGEIDVGNAGTAARFLTAMLACSEGQYLVRASKQMSQRPMKDLLKALEELGAEFTYLLKPYVLPFQIRGMQGSNHVKNENCFRTQRGVSAKTVHLDIDKSSQFLSALLMTAVMTDEDLVVLLTGQRKAKSYVNITIRMMEQFGCRVEHPEENQYIVRKENRYQANHYRIEPDISAACYFYAMAACTGNTAVVEGVFKESMQGDIKFLDILEAMGCKIHEGNEGIYLTGPKNGRLKGIDIDLSDCSDQSMTLAAIAPFADGPVTIRNIGHIRNQESDRIHAIAEELTRMGIHCKEEETSIRIYPGIPKPVTVQTYEDHRMAMAFAVTGLRVPGMKIADPDCCAKTFQEYFDVLEDLIK